jgi:hypothetical protein
LDVRDPTRQAGLGQRARLPVAHVYVKQHEPRTGRIGEACLAAILCLERVVDLVLGDLIGLQAAADQLDVDQNGERGAIAHSRRCAAKGARQQGREPWLFVKLYRNPILRYDRLELRAGYTVFRNTSCSRPPRAAPVTPVRLEEGEGGL